MVDAVIESPSANGGVSGASLDSFQALADNPQAMFQLLDMFPIPIEIFAPDGLSLFVNRALLDFNGIADADLIVGKYNLLKDPFFTEDPGRRGGIARAFRGEAASMEFPLPMQNLVERSVVTDKPFESALVAATLFPMRSDGALAFVGCVFFVKNIYRGKPDIAKAKAYIENHWQEGYDPEAVAKSVHMSVRQLYRLFNQHMGMAPGDYYKQCKVEHIKQRLADRSLSVKEAFAACGEDNRGAYAKIFKNIVGTSPREYRESLR